MKEILVTVTNQNLPIAIRRWLAEDFPRVMKRRGAGSWLKSNPRALFEVGRGKIGIFADPAVAGVMQLVAEEFPLEVSDFPTPLIVVDEEGTLEMAVPLQS